VLLVLDNCEHVVDACAELAAALLSSCGDVRIMAASRESLRVEGETVWRSRSRPRTRIACSSNERGAGGRSRPINAPGCRPVAPLSRRERGRGRR
jgi:predicted ATPase